MVGIMKCIFNDLKTIVRITLCSLSNFFFWVLGKIVRRDDKIVLFGAWMGNRFADNSRFLFQYLSANKEMLNVQRVIWVTRNPLVVDELKQMGYETYLIGTKESAYWHLKSGIHIMCNMSAKSGRHLPDIDVKYSAGANKIQLWHGVGIKAVGVTSNASQNISVRRSKGVSRFANKEFVRKNGSLGGWLEPKILCTSKLNLKINLGNTKIHEHNAFISGYPRYCGCVKYTEREKKIVARIKNFSLRVLYLPTFRDEGSVYKHPLESMDFRNFLEKNDILWIEKPHQAELKKQENLVLNNLIQLEPEFDVNVLLEDVDVIVSDYSSAAFDAICLGKPSIMYVPDLDAYEKGSNGLLFNMRDLCPALLEFDLNSLMHTIKEVIDGNYFSSERRDTLNKLKMDFFGNNEYSYRDIWQDIQECISK